MQEILANLDQTLQEFIIRLLCLPTNQPINPAWSAHDLLSHITYWHEVYADSLTAITQGRQPNLPQGTYASINAQAVCVNAEVSSQILVGRLRSAQATIHEQAPLAAKTGRKIAFKQSSTRRTIPQALQRIEQHIHPRPLSCTAQTSINRPTADIICVL